MKKPNIATEFFAMFKNTVMRGAAEPKERKPFPKMIAPPPQEIAEWNERVDAKKGAKIDRKVAAQFSPV